MTNRISPKRRRSIRLKGFDYSISGTYFITICVQNMECRLGQVIDGEMRENHAGIMVGRIWHSLSNRYNCVELDSMIVMPNHLHGIIILTSEEDYIEDHAFPDNRAGTRPAPTIGDIVGAYKSLTTNEYIQGVRDGKFPPFKTRLWQRNYWERIVRNERELEAIRQYIGSNPASWQKDELFVNV